MQNKTVGIIGAGQLGSRHLQALAYLDEPVEIVLVDPSKQSVATALERAAQAEVSHRISTCSSVEEVKQPIDLAIVATSSLQRRMVVEALVKAGVKSMVLEKFLFPKLEDYSFVSDLFTENQVKAWVNCPRRMYQIYQDIRDDLSTQNIISLHVTGTNWNLGSNAIHMVDLFSFLSGRNDIEYPSQSSQLSSRQDKRAGYETFVGNIHGRTARGDFLELTSWESDFAPFFTITIATPAIIYRIDELAGQGPTLQVARQEQNWKWDPKSFTVPFQSQLSHVVVKDILQNAKCDLTSFEDSSILHKQLLSLLLSIYQHDKKTESLICPIT